MTLLTGGARDRTARQQTLRGAIDWSYNLLAPDEQTLFARMGVFVGGCTFEASEHVGGSTDAEAREGGTFLVLEGLQGLVDESLLRRIDSVEGEPRFVMLETIREYASECLLERGELDETRRRHADFYLRLASSAEQALRGPQQGLWLRRIEAEHDNLRAALQWAAEVGHTDLGLRLASALHPFWTQRGYWTEGRSRLEAALAGALGWRRRDGTPVPVSPDTLVPDGSALVATVLWQIGSLAALQRD
ncbi:MAG TPA: hypothetical protein VEZ12_13440, partial [Herpetosiphonaceae bacterium]|nr:hypothetical protein [Herpetosiphonaceae bacterium]